MARVVRLEAVSVPGGPENHDAFGISGDLFWVIDGATPLCGDEEGELNRFISDVDSGLRARTFSEKPLSEILAEVAREMLPKYCGNREPWEQPSCAIAVVRLLDGAVEYLVLGDATVVIGSGNGNKIFVLEDKKLRPLDERAVEEKTRLQREKGMTSLQARTAITRLLREHRRLMNRPEGYWIFNADPKACCRAKTGVIKNVRGIKVLLATDGFARLVDTFGFATWEAVMRKLAAYTLRELVAVLRSLEVADQECLAYPRFATYDDATAVYVEVS
ncbi:hypothetical protein SAMN00808754_1430 [Thermanaeromonas toyohensis ToBE]|uniref:Protein phosphatase 2C n=1 Tax=Thermanaeromonas toyohensis ToBE TaxID=698762 RepID=A0A1W1VS81_9FIRM|nr:hypothetical protein [Thermanaeromonas toyohensis]SMB96232.1 hypothetical protein SAMN00808754_1430 [Thermanaeromonas toyohensis ToBE]